MFIILNPRHIAGKMRVFISFLLVLGSNGVCVREECSCNPVRYFAILSMQRSGSGWFETLLNNHTNISSNGEIFSVKDRRANVSTIFETLDKVYNLDWLSSASKNECTSAVGLKWMLNQVNVLSHLLQLKQYVDCYYSLCVFITSQNVYLLC